jgi:hypothetical protein
LNAYDVYQDENGVIRQRGSSATYFNQSGAGTLGGHVRGAAIGDASVDGGASLEEQMSRTPEYYKALVSGAFDTGPPFGYGADVRAMLSQTDMDRKLAHGWRATEADEARENAKAIYPMQIRTHFDRLTRLSPNIEDRRPRDAAGNLINSIRVPSTRPPPVNMNSPEGQAWMREQNDAFDSMRQVPMYSSGGVVGSTPVPHRLMSATIFRHAPRFADGLAADEYPAVLHAGETVTPSSMRSRSSGQPIVINTPASPAPQVVVNVMNNANAQVSTSTQEDNGGGVKLDIIIDQLVSSKMRDGGSQISRTLSTMGARAQPIRR